MSVGLANAGRRTAGNFESAHDAATAREELTCWLLGPHVQVASGEHAGAVVGWVDRDGNASYAYPEITGYYLQWLAWLAADACTDETPRDRTRGETRRRALAAQRWLLSWAHAGDTPQTRIYLQRAEPDWRNGALFFFDLAMVARGLANAARAGLIEVDRALIERISALLSTLIGEDGMFEACRASSADVHLPPRWSTRRGPFLAKAASGVLLATAAFPAMPRELQRAADATFAASLDSLTGAEQGEAHPLLYAIEGALSLPAHPAAVRTLAQIRRHVRDLLGQWSDDGYLPESLRGAGRPRLDIVAQGIRAAVLLLDDEASKQIIARMTRALASHVDAQRGIRFSPSDDAVQYNAWTAMFAEQALFAATSADAACSRDLHLCLV
jgi:hypothetical protein